MRSQDHRQILYHAHPVLASLPNLSLHHLLEIYLSICFFYVGRCYRYLGLCYYFGLLPGCHYLFVLLQNFGLHRLETLLESDLFFSLYDLSRVAINLNVGLFYQGMNRQVLFHQTLEPQFCALKSHETCLDQKLCFARH